MARPSKVGQWLTEDGLSLLEHWKRNDLTDAEIAKKIGISPTTLKDWKDRYPPISEAIKKGFEYCLADAESALLLKFKPYTYEEEKKELWEVNTGEVDRAGKPIFETKGRHIVRTKKTVMPDTAAIIFFLKAKGGWKEAADIKGISAQISIERRKEIEDFFDSH